MSLAHIRVTRVRLDASMAEYKVESPDFSRSGEWAPIGLLLLCIPARTYEFRPSALWQESKALPPEVFGCEEAERVKLLDSQYKGFGWGAWAKIIHAYASQFLTSENFPRMHPLSSFSD